jgi:putative intracellular protease/amidase
MSTTIGEVKPKLLVGILLFDEVEVLDFCGPFEVFSIAGNSYEGSFKVL